jgi:hypothetical protein
MRLGQQQHAGHAHAVAELMEVPVQDARAGGGRDGPVLFAHADLSGFSVFEEAAWWGIRAAQKAMS